MSHAHSPKSSADASLYDRDLYAWSLEQASLLKAGRFGEIDAENIAEEILDVAKTEYRVLESALRILLAHMLKWDHQPERRSRSWENTIAEHRDRAHRQLRDNPSLTPRLEEAVADAYRSARRLASTQLRREVETFPEDCPYDWATIMHRPYNREDADRA